jgi:hypothetical protein
MKKLAACFILFNCLFVKAQVADSSAMFSHSILKNFHPGDSVIYYQCHVEEAVQQITTVSGQTLVAKPQPYSITEKYVITKSASGYSVNYYSSAVTSFPNRRFSGLKVKERDYWLFKKEKTFSLNEHDLKILLALEKKGREAIEYDYAITKYTTNQIIIRLKKDFKQLVIDGNYVLSKLIIHD